MERLRPSSLRPSRPGQARTIGTTDAPGISGGAVGWGQVGLIAAGLYIRSVEGILAPRSQ